MYGREIRELGLAEIQHKLTEAHQELFNLRFQLSSRQLKDFNQFKKVKKEIARLNTIASEKAGN